MRKRRETVIGTVWGCGGAEYRHGTALREHDERIMNSASAGTAVPRVGEVSL
ncbi:hypothetical protein [Nocardia xishanensis]|uniref:Uncharacterized protein n=1 Tax=Nocardia xishanensis TaxID=238964 RepID=A0ABW7WTZ1_9NOCA